MEFDIILCWRFLFSDSLELDREPGVRDNCIERDIFELACIRWRICSGEGVFRERAADGRRSLLMGVETAAAHVKDELERLRDAALAMRLAGGYTVMTFSVLWLFFGSPYNPFVYAEPSTKFRSSSDMISNADSRAVTSTLATPPRTYEPI